MSRFIVLRIVAKLLIPLILLFALYVQFHGDFGPGGGFQAGVLFGAGIILYALIFGARMARRVFSPGLTQTMMAVGVLIYLGVGCATLFKGGEFLNYSVFATDPVIGQHLGILLVELGVGITVSGAMIGLFYSFTGKEK